MYYPPDEGARSTLAEHLDQLRYKFRTLAERLREAIAEVVGQAVDRIIRQTVRFILSRSPPEGEPPLYEPEQRTPSGSLWQPEERRWPYDRDAYSDYEDEDERYSPPEPSPQPAEEVPSLWRRAAVVLCRLAAWWLQRRRMPYPVFTAVGVGLASGLAVYVSGPLLASGLVGSAVALSIFTDLVETGARTLSPP